MDLFHSTYTNRLDVKSRLSIPAEFRDVLNQRASRCVVLYPAIDQPAIDGASEDYIEHIRRSMDALPPLSRERDDFIDAILPNIQCLKWDAGGRIVLPQGLMRHAGLTHETNVVLVGRGQSFQIWEPGAWARRQDEARSRVHAMRAAGGTR